MLRNIILKIPYLFINVNIYFGCKLDAKEQMCMGEKVVLFWGIDFLTHFQTYVSKDSGPRERIVHIYVIPPPVHFLVHIYRLVRIYKYIRMPIHTSVFKVIQLLGQSRGCGFRISRPVWLVCRPVSTVRQVRTGHPDCPVGPVKLISPD